MNPREVREWFRAAPDVCWSEAFVGARPRLPSGKEQNNNTKGKEAKAMRKSNPRVVGLDLHPDSFAGGPLAGPDPARARVLSTSTRADLKELEQWAARQINNTAPMTGGTGRRERVLSSVPSRNRRRGGTRGGRSQATPHQGSSRRGARARRTTGGNARRSIRIQDLTKAVMARRAFGLAEERLVLLEATWHIADTDDRPRAVS
jgi:hypothetical protein